MQPGGGSGVAPGGRGLGMVLGVDLAAAGPPLALQMTKRMLTSSMGLSLSEALHQEAMAQTVTAGTEDTIEAFKAFFQKREPVFKGR